MRVLTLLTETLEDLDQLHFKKFKTYLSEDDLEGFNRIGSAHLEKADQMETARKMIDNSGEESAVKVTVEILKEMKLCGSAEKLERKYAAGKPATPAASSSSSAAAPPAAPAAPGAITAQNGSIVIAPNIVGGTCGALTFNVNK